MAKKTDIKTCRYKNCKHKSNKIDISSEPYKAVGSCYYHEDCYETKTAEEEKEAKIKSDIQLIKNMWISNINNTVVYSQLFKVLNQLIRERGIDSEYVIFALQYVIDHKMNLNYPNGFLYYVDKKEIKDAYKKKMDAQNRVDIYSFKANRTDDAPKFSVNKKPSGFNSILGGKR